MEEQKDSNLIYYQNLTKESFKDTVCELVAKNDYWNKKDLKEGYYFKTKKNH